MRKPRDFDSEMKALNERAKLLKERKVHQLGELVIACGADALSIETLAGALLAAAATMDASTKEGWRKRGVAFFQRARRDENSAGSSAARGAASESGAKPSAAAASTS